MCAAVGWKVLYICLLNPFALFFNPEYSLEVKKELMGPGHHLRPVRAGRVRPPLQWTLCLAPVGTTKEG